MAVLGILLSIVGLGVVCWLIFSVAVYALPFAIGLSAGLAAIHSGAGVVGGFIIGGLAGGLALMLGQITFASVRAPVARTAIGLLYAVPAAIAGYHMALELAQLGMSTGIWQEAFAIFGAVMIGSSAWARLALPGVAPRAGGSAHHQTPLPVSATARGR